MSDGAPMTVRIAGGSKRIEVVAVDDAAFDVRGDARVTQTDRWVTVDEVTSKLFVRVPAGTDLTIGTSSGRVEVSGPVGHAAVITESGRIEVERATSVDLRTASASVEVGDVDGFCRIRAASGRVEVERCGAVDVAGKTGRVELHNVSGDVDVHTVNGRVEIDMAAAHDVRAETLTGRVEVSLPPGVSVFRPEPGDRSLRPPTADCTVVARSETGTVVVETR